MANILVVDDDEGFRTYVTLILEKAGYTVTQAGDGEIAVQLLEKESFELVITDLSMPRIDGLELVRRLTATQPEVQIVVFTAHGSIETAVEAMKLGAFDFVEKPLRGPEQMSLLVERALERRRLLSLQEYTDRQSDNRAPQLGYGAASMQNVVRAVEKVSPTDATVLLLGESGTGKEVVARSIHQNSRRANAPFVVVNCAALPTNLVESELFGHEKGAFTGATARRRGRIELAEGGTFFLDEVGELAPEVQAKFLRVLEDGTFEHVGGQRTIKADVRWIAATNRDLREMIGSGHFREDLYQRLSLFPLQLPPLRERRSDIIPLAEHLLQRIGLRTSRPMTLHGSAAEALERHLWKGNIRELSNVLERACIMADGAELHADDLFLETAESTAPMLGVTARREHEREQLIAALAEAQGNRRRAAEILGIGERTLYDRMKRYEVH